MEVGIKAAKSELSKMVKAAMAGEKVVITNHGKPLARLVPEPQKPKHAKRGYGALKDILILPPGWDSIEEEEKWAEEVFEVVREAKGLPPL